MEGLQIANDINLASSWLAKNEELFCSYTLHITSSIIIMIIGICIAKGISEGINGILTHRCIDETVAGFLSTLLQYVIIAVSFVASISCIGVQITSIIAVLGAAGVAVGLALQGSLSNFAAGTLLVTLRPLRTGEYVNLCNINGTVLNVHIFYTMLRTLDGKIVIVPNSKILDNNIINYSREPARRNEFMIRVAYNTDVDFVIEVLKQVTLNEPRVLQDRGVVVGLSELSPSSMNFIIRCWSYTDDLNSVYWDLMIKFKKALDKNNIDSPYPQLDVHIHKKTKL
ncbi:Small-conductance mechanosensitive channel [Buchnera aphidicola (Anoecia corni)]|uniref:Small-conductance mechanosensitive channel n=1 Tax=Buchnera aphidicola (Anoecia corni) TaxID=2994477 RepID=A0AAT9IGG9_9GAMM